LKYLDSGEGREQFQDIFRGEQSHLFKVWNQSEIPGVQKALHEQGFQVSKLALKAWLFEKHYASQ
jgi:hypothetical protein